ncbi:hypothetical protein ACFWZ2_27145 [Streptomyces sp. NPDC059002]|uniref:hypothetical protein n=1 Tax=Streptomyces sp. NPDC059002 TaxID=3346690 RepID=UPI0036BB3684
MIEHKDGLAWIATEADGPEHFYLVFGQGVTPRELAICLGAPEDSPVLDAATIEAIDDALPPWGRNAPNIGRIGDAGNGWSFCLLPCTFVGAFGAESLPPEPTARLTRMIDIDDTGMDPANVGYSHDDTFVWGWFDGEPHEGGAQPDLFTDRLRALGLPPLPAGDEDPDEVIEAAYDRQYELVYQVLSEHFGIGLPRDAVAGNTLPGMVCEPRELRYPVYAPAPDGRLQRTGTRTEPNPRWVDLRAHGFDM